MPILAIFTGVGITRDHYETLRREVGWEQRHPSGAMFHAASFDTAGNAHVVDVWESQQQLDAFVGSRLMPAMQKHGVAAPAVEVYPIHNLNTYPAIAGFALK